VIVRVRAVQTGDGAYRREAIAELMNDLRVARKCRQGLALGSQPPAHAVPDGI
jgi:hypothetical protein